MLKAGWSDYSSNLPANLLVPIWFFPKGVNQLKQFGPAILLDAGPKGVMVAGMRLRCYSF